MPNFSNISNGESGLSVRNTLNQVIDYVNTGITQDDKYVTGGTYNNSTGTLTLNRQNGSVNVTGFLTGVTETQNLENVLALGNTTGANDIIVQSNILVGNGNRIQETISGNTYIEINQTFIDINGSDGGVNSSYLNVSDTSSTLSSTDGTRNNYVTIDGGIGNIEITSQDGIDYQSDIIISTDFGSSIASTSQNLTTGEITTQTLSPTSNISLVDNDGTSQIYTQVTQQESEFLVQVEDAISGGSSSFSIQPNYSSWNSDNVPTDERVGLEFDPSGGFGQTRFYKENYVTNESSGIFLNVNQVLTRYVSSAATINYIDINDFGIDSQTYGSPTQFQSTNGVSSNTFTLAPTSTILLSTDGTWTNTSTIDPDRSINEITDGTINGKIDLDVNNNGIVLEMSNGLEDTSITLTQNSMDFLSTDGNASASHNVYTTGIQIATSDTGSTFSNNISVNMGVTPGMSLTSSDPSSSDTSGIELRPDWLSLSSSDGTATSTIAQDPTESYLGSYWLADNGTWSSKLSLDPTDNFDQTGLETTDGTNTNMIRVNQGGVTITTADGVNSVDLSFTSTNLLLTGIPSFDDDTAASGLTAGSIYQTTGGGASPLNVAGILMIKQ